MSVSRTHADKPSIIDVMWMLDFVWAFPGDVGLRSRSINARLRWLFVCYWSKPRIINSFRLATVVEPNEEIAVKKKRQADSVWSSITFWSCRTNEALKWTPMDFYNVHPFFPFNLMDFEDAWASASRVDRSYVTPTDRVVFGDKHNCAAPPRNDPRRGMNAPVHSTLHSAFPSKQITTKNLQATAEASSTTGTMALFSNSPAPFIPPTKL